MRNVTRNDDQSLLEFGSVAALENAGIAAEPAAFGQADLWADSGAWWDSEAAVAAVLASVPCGVLLFECDGDLRAVNGHLAETLGYSRNELLELGSFERLAKVLAPHFADPEAIIGRWRQRQRVGEACWDELDMISPNPKVLERFGRPIVDSQGRRSGWIEVYRDVAGRKLVQGNQFHIERMIALGQLVSSVAHELSNPLTSILCYAQLLRRRRHTSQGEEDLDRILQEAERATRIAKSLLQSARGSKPERAAVDLNQVVRSVVTLRAMELAREEIKIRLDLDPNLPPVLGDAAQLQQVLLNLLMNSEQAIRQAQARGSVCLRTRRAPGNRLAVDVVDDGPGIPPESLPRIFDPFYTTKPAGVGTGLGLSIAYGIAHDHGGSISVQSRPGCGAAFSLELPIALAPPLTATTFSRYEANGHPAADRSPGNPSRSERIS